MAIYQQHILDIQAKMQGLAGLKAWGVAYSSYCFLTIEFGRPRASEEADGPTHGEWHLWLYGCMWRLEQDGCVVVASEDNRETIATETLLLEGKVLEAIEVLTPALDVIFTFEDNIILRTFSVHTKDEEMDSWMLFTPDKVITVEASGQWTYGE